jgi:hypothetical protein
MSQNRHSCRVHDLARQANVARQARAWLKYKSTVPVRFEPSDGKANMSSLVGAQGLLPQPGMPTRRDFLTVAATAFAAIGVAVPPYEFKDPNFLIVG